MDAISVPLASGGVPTSASQQQDRIATPHSLAARACQAHVLEALSRPEAAEEVWRRTYIQLDHEVGPRHHSTLEFMAHLGRNVSLLQSRCGHWNGGRWENMGSAFFQLYFPGLAP